MPRVPNSELTATNAIFPVNGLPRRVLNFAGCNYLGLAHEPRVHAAAIRGMGRYGLTTTASRETTGNTDAHTGLERELAEFLGMDSAILTTEGYTANMALCEALGQSHKVALIDEKSHRSVGHAAEASGMRVMRYRHRDAAHAAELARTAAREVGADGVVILTDGVFTADGVIAPLRELVKALPGAGSVLVVDDCHGFCVLGQSGRGTCDHLGVRDPRIVITTTLGKGLGCYGGVIAGAKEVIDRVQQGARIYRGTTPCPPPLIEAAREAVRVLIERPQLSKKLLEQAAYLRKGLTRCGVKLNDAPTPILAFVLDSETQMDEVSAGLLQRGVFAPVIEYPGGPAQRYFRITLTAEHTREHLDQLIEGFATLLDAKTLVAA
ncbi:MAG: pyridoxal phosphate-dependent aminotransferase family protein [Planctomycetes bacterium]|nr:pyridoxal phosphate-dependent aminotransferase family protein [Planctomycetota bacterium]